MEEEAGLTAQLRVKGNFTDFLVGKHFRRLRRRWEDNIEMDHNETGLWRWEVDESGLGLCSLEGYGISSVEPSDSATMKLVQ
jgi:hypothetical protein